jgi:hypothetical protein
MDTCAICCWGSRAAVRYIEGMKGGRREIFRFDRFLLRPAVPPARIRLSTAVQSRSFSAKEGEMTLRNLTSPAVAASVLAILLTGALAEAAQTGSTPAAKAGVEKRIVLGNTVLLLETTDTALDTALGSLGQPFDSIVSDVWTGIDFSPYNIVFIGMDGGLIDEADVAAVRSGAIDAGVRVCWFGGTSLSEFANGVEISLMDIDANISWTISTTPHFTVVNPAHPMAASLPGSMTFASPEAAFYMLRPTDAAITVAGENGDGFDSLFFKGSGFPGGGTGELVWLTNSPFASYWTVPGDMAFLTQVVDNCLQPVVPVELQYLTVE